MSVIALPALSDNYIWIYQSNGEALVVDPGESTQVLDYLSDNGLNLHAILLTHNHQDHTDGVCQIVTNYPKALVIGPDETKSFNTNTVAPSEQVNLLDLTFDVLLTNGHTPGHVSYCTDQYLFCGDAMFSGGCGRVFTGDYQAQFNTMQRFAKLDEAVQVFAGHEYTETNLTFACDQESDNKRIARELSKVKQQRRDGKPTLPSTIGYERKVNLFLQADTVEEFKRLRDKRDDY